MRVKWGVKREVGILVSMLQYNWFRTLIQVFFQVSVTATIVPDRFQQGRKNSFKVIAIGERERSERCLSSALLTQRIGRFLRAGVREVIDHLHLLIGLTQRESKRYPIFEQKISLQLGEILTQVRLLTSHKDWEVRAASSLMIIFQRGISQNWETLF